MNFKDSKEKDFMNHLIKHSKPSLTATLIAGILLSLSSIETVSGQEIENKEQNTIASERNLKDSNEISANKNKSYIVKAGDSLNKIAKEHGMTTEELAILNNIKDMNRIYVGQKISIYQLDNDLEDLPKIQSKGEFIEILAEHAQAVAKEHKLYASVMIAQASLETGFGSSLLSAAPNHNLYGMKGNYQGQSVLMPTKEYSPQKGWYNIKAYFKKYPSYLESMLDHAEYLRQGTYWHPGYYSGVWIENTESYRDATAWLEGRYATDPNYASKLNRIIRDYDLTRYDLKESPDSEENQPVEKPVTPSTGDKQEAAPSVKIYKVKSGDNLSKIAKDHKMSIKELKDLNHLKTDLIFVDQELKVKVDKPESSKPESKPQIKPENKPVEKPAEEKDSYKSYRVKKGDTLYKIASKHKLTVSELKKLNHLKSNLIYIGQNLKTKEAEDESSKGEQTAEKKVYRVKSGDSLYRIARKNKTTVKKIKANNQLKSDLIFVGQELKL